MNKYKQLVTDAIKSYTEQESLAAANLAASFSFLTEPCRRYITELHEIEIDTIVWTSATIQPDDEDPEDNIIYLVGNLTTVDRPLNYLPFALLLRMSYLDDYNPTTFHQTLQAAYEESIGISRVSDDANEYSGSNRAENAESAEENVAYMYDYGVPLP